MGNGLVERVIVLRADGTSCHYDLPGDALPTSQQMCAQMSAQMGAHPSKPANVFAQKFPDFPHAAHAAALGSGDPVGAYDPHAVQREFPMRWQAYIRANFRNLLHVQQVFGVSETAARKWWNGKGGVNGSYTAIAMREHPVAAQRMLFAAE